ncbi:MAG: DUF445 family protein [Bacteroidaceae bacterium]|nr:DUF445 family protein [Bacteroidaceae bacterium]
MIHYILAPFLGGVIGYITNDIAIRMLFRPHTAKFLFGMHIPFTPGLIPKEKARIAVSIGDAISENLMSNDVLQRYLLSEEMIAKLRSSVEDFLDAQRVNEETVMELLSHYLSEEEIAAIALGINESLTDQVSVKLVDPAVGKQVAKLAMDHVADKLNGEGAQILLSGLGGLIGGLGGAAAALFGGNIVGKFLSMLREPAENYLADNINSMMKANGKQFVSNMVGDGVNTFLNKKVCDLLKGHDEQLAQAVNTIESLYRTIINEHLPKLLDSVDISKIVRERINEMDVNETEKLIFQVMKKELKAIVWLGALLGMVMGSINCLIL